MFSVSIPSCSASTSAAAAEGARPSTEPDSMLGFPGSPQSRHSGRLAGAGRSDQHVEPAARGGDLLHCEGLIDRKRMAPAGQREPDVTAATVPVATAGPSILSPGIEQAGLGVDEDGGGVDLVALGPEPAGPIGPA